MLSFLSPWIWGLQPRLQVLACKKGAKGGSENGKTAQKYAKKPQTASDFLKADVRKTCDIFW